jgi:cation diffusion facilitator CzcD-associated flavoprotein CzcO
MSDAAPHLHEVAIIGTGFSGQCLGIKLKEAGIDDFVILEKEHDVGGVWRDNTYPGCACDIPSHLYSFSFELNSEWSRLYPSQPELRAYLNHCADKYGLREHIRFGAEVSTADFDAGAGLWTVRTVDGRVFCARSLANGAGALSRPGLPDIPGIERFAGPKFHSMRWDHDFDLADKRVAVIGTGASAIQFVPRIVRKVGKLHLFQRTPPWILPKRDPSIPPWMKRLFRLIPFAQRMFRAFLYWMHEIAALNFLNKDRHHRIGETAALEFLEQAVPDEALRKRITPDYLMGCKRVLLSNDYLWALTRENLELVTDGIQEITERGVRTKDGVEREVDAIIFGTGFQATDFTGTLRIRGLDGRELSSEWSAAAPSYLGVMTEGFPNYFMITGPNTGLGHNSMVFMIEAQVHYIVKCLKKLRARKLRYMDVLRRAQDAFVGYVQTRMQQTVWVSGCKSWYLSADGCNFTLWPSFTFQYWWRLRRVRLSDFRLVGDSGHALPAPTNGAPDTTAPGTGHAAPA